MIEKVIGKYIGFDVNSMVTQIVIIFESMTMLQRMAKFCCLGTKLILWWMNGIFKYYLMMNFVLLVLVMSKTFFLGYFSILF